MPLSLSFFKWLVVWRTSSSVRSASASTRTLSALAASTTSVESASQNTGADRSLTEHGTVPSAGGPLPIRSFPRVSNFPTLWNATQPSLSTPSLTLREAPTLARTTRRSSSSAWLTRAWCASSATSRRYTSSTRSPLLTKLTRRYRSVIAHTLWQLISNGESDIF